MKKYFKLLNKYPYSRGAVLCRLAKSQSYVSKKECHISCPVSGSEDCQSENGSSCAPSLPPGFPEDLLHDFSVSPSYTVCSTPQLQNDYAEDTNINGISKDENSKDFCKFNSSASLTAREFSIFSDKKEIHIDPDFCPSTFTESIVSPEKNDHIDDPDYCPSTFAESIVSPEKNDHIDDPDYCPSTFTESSVSPEKNDHSKTTNYAPSTHSDLDLSNQKNKIEKYSGWPSASEKSPQKKFSQSLSQKFKTSSTTEQQNSMFQSKTGVPNLTNSKVKVQNLQESAIRYRKNYCPYCQIQLTHLPRHMINKHRIERKVQEFLSYSTKSKERKAILEELRKLGNFKHNSYVINNKEGEILTTVRPKKRTSPNNFVPCRNCLGFFPKALLWRHNKRCKNIYKIKNPLNKRLVGHGLNLLTTNKSCSRYFMERVIAPMNCDDINLTVRNDVLILKLGESMFSKNPEPWKFRYHRNAMRQMARLLINIRDIDKSISSLTDAINPTKFQSLVLATKNLAGYDGESSFDHGSLVLKVGINIKKCAEILSGISLDDGNEDLLNACERFIKRLDREWSSSISSVALRDMHQKKFNKPKYLPLVEDFQKLNKYISGNTKNVFTNLNRLRNDPEALENQKPLIQKLCMDLMNLTLSSLILFNRRRSGEAERIMVDHYKKGLQASSTCEDLYKVLNSSEEILCKYFRRIEIPGKRGNKVPVILSNLHVSCIDLILEFRDYIGVNTDNKFLFPRQNCKSLNPISGVKSLKDIVNMADLKKPETMLSTNLRKHMATMSQLLNLSQHELEELCKLMGHDIRIHTSYYRLPDDAVQLGKLTKVLLAAQNGNILKYRNKNIDDIELDPEELVSGDEAGVSDDDEEDEAANIFDEEEVDDYLNKKVKPENDQVKSTSLKNSRKICSPRKGKCVKRPFSQKEKQLVEVYFKDFIKRQKLPRKEDCTKFLLHNKNLFEGRNWLHLKNYVRNKIVSISRIIKN